MAPDQIAITPSIAPLKSTIVPPGSKSITNRAMLLAAMARGRSVLRDALLSNDTDRMAAALTRLGFRLEVSAESRIIRVEGGGGAIPTDRADLDAGDAGTAMRFLTGFLTLGRGRYRIDGSARMRERPLGALLDAMRHLGANVQGEIAANCPPIVLDTTARDFDGGAVTLDASLSSQFASALLMPAPLWHRGLMLRVLGDAARPFITMTLKLMELWGARSSEAEGQITIAGGQQYRARDFTVEPDASAASYFAAAAALVGGSITLPGLTRNSVQGDLGFLDVLERMGAQLAWKHDCVVVTGGAQLSGVDLAMHEMPDVVPTLAALAPFAQSPTRIRKVGFIRHHESDRLAALATELRGLGAAVEEFDDGLGIAPSKIHGGVIETYNDHRIAMAFSIVGLRTAGVVIKNPGCVAKTYPDFFDDLKRLSSWR